MQLKLMNKLKGRSKMEHETTSKRRIIAALLTTFFLMQQSMVMPSVATTIGGGDNWVAKGQNGTFDIDPTGWNTKTKTGYRMYEQFDLSQGDIANLIFKYKNKDINTFVNFVNGKININGIVNSMRDGNFYNGKAVFISPNGMVVGASGVLNVGSLQVLTPTQSDYDNLKLGDFGVPANGGDISSLEQSKGGAEVKIEGKVFTQNSVDINAGSVTVANNAAILAGLGEGKMKKMDSIGDATKLFSELVNANNLKSGSALSSENGKIVITAYNGGSGNGNVNVEGNVTNFGTGDVDVTSEGGMTVASTGLVGGRGKVNLKNSGNKGMDIQGHVIGHGVNLTNSNSSITIGDSSSNDNYVTSYGNVDINISGGDLKGNGGGKDTPKTHIVTENNGNLKITVTGGGIGDGQVGKACSGGECVGVGPDARDLSKSVNTRVSGRIDASADKDINLASIGTDMRVGRIASQNGRVILLADSKVKGQTAYSILNANDNGDINVEGNGVSLIASGSIGDADKDLNIKPNGGGVDMLALKGNIFVRSFG